MKWKRKAKQAAAFFVGVVLSISTMFGNDSIGKSIGGTIEVSAMTQSRFDSKLAEAKNMFGEGSRWDERYNYPSCSGCFAYAHWIAEYVTESSNSLSGWSYIYNINDVRAGDIIQYGNPTVVTIPYPHSIFVTAVSGDTITYTDANFDGKNGVRWNRTMSKSAAGGSPLGNVGSFSYILRNPNFSIDTSSPVGSLMQENPSHRPISDGDYFIVSALEGDRFTPGSRCLTFEGLPGNKNSNDTNAELWNVYGQENHVFTVTWRGNGFYEIKLKNSNQCLDVLDGNPQRGTNVQSYEDHDGIPQQWYISETDNGIGYTIQARCSGYYLDVEGACTDDGTNIRLWEGNGTNAERWYFIPWDGSSSAKPTIADGEYHIMAQDTDGMVMSLEGYGIANGTKIVLQPEQNSYTDTFQVTWLGNGYYEIVNLYSGRSLDAEDSASKLNTEISLYDYDSSHRYNQTWIIRPCSDGSGAFNIISKANGLCVDFNFEDGIAQGKKISLACENGGKGQKWKFVPCASPESVSLNEDNLTLCVGQSATLRATIAPDYANDQTLTWSFDSRMITTAGLDRENELTVTAKAVGATEVSVWTCNNKKATCEVVIREHNYGTSWKSNAEKHWKECSCGEKSEESAHSFVWKTDEKAGGAKYEECSVCGMRRNVAATSVKLSEAEKILKKNEGFQLYATVEPQNFTDGVVWTTSDNNVASVSESGYVKAYGAGTATIKATAGDKSATCIVTVSQPVTSVRFTKDSCTMKAGETKQLAVQISPDNATNKELTYTSSDTAVVTVSSTGAVKANGTGTATITAAAKDGSGKSATCRIVVEDTAKDDVGDIGKDDVEDTGKDDVGDTGKDDVGDTGKDDVGDTGKDDVEDTGKDDIEDTGKDDVEGGTERKNGILQGSDGNWYYYVDGTIDEGYTGLAYDSTVGWWLIVDGKVDFGYTGLWNDANCGWWLINNGAVAFEYTGLWNDANCGWWLINNGTVAFEYTGLWNDANCGWWLISNGAVAFEYMGLWNDANCGWWLINNGTVAFEYTGLWNDANCGWWLIGNGAVAFGYTGLWNDTNCGWWYVNGGTVDFGAYGLVANDYGWWYVNGGAIDFGYTGLAYDANVGWWYVNGGAIDFGANGLAPYGDCWYCVNGGMLDWGYTGTVNWNGGTYYVANGVVVF